MKIVYKTSSINAEGCFLSTQTFWASRVVQNAFWLSVFCYSFSLSWERFMSPLQTHLKLCPGFHWLENKLILRLIPILPHPNCLSQNQRAAFGLLLFYNFYILISVLRFLSWYLIISYTFITLMKYRWIILLIGLGSDIFCHIFFSFLCLKFFL